MRKKLIFRLYFGLALAEGVLLLSSLVRVPSDPENAFLLGFSITRLVVLIAVSVALATFGLLFLISL